MLDFVNLIAYRLYLEDNNRDAENILRMRLKDNYGLILLCGKPHLDVVKSFAGLHIAGKNLSLTKARWNVLYIGKGKCGYNLPWSILLQIVRRHKDISYFAFSDADEQIPFREMANIKIHNGTSVVLPQRSTRRFGEFTFERSIIEDIENAFIRITAGRHDIADFQSGLFVAHRRVAESLDFGRMREYKWIGDLYFVEQVIKRGFPLQCVGVETSKRHNTSFIFDYAGPLNEMLMGIPILKMKELVDYTGLNLREIKNSILGEPERFLPTFFGRAHKSSRKGKGCLSELRGYMDFISNLYYKTADLYQFKI